MGYTKLFNEIVMSTVWHEPHTTRILWITMLAIKDRWHLVNASIPGLASTAMITLEECEAGLKTLALPDPYSRTQEFEGRRIEKVDGGWAILNGEKYRNKMTQDERNEYQRIKQREYRAKKKRVKSCLQKGKRVTEVMESLRRKEEKIPHTPSKEEKKTDTKELVTSSLVKTASNLYDKPIKTPSKIKIPYQQIVDLYHKMLPTLPRCEKLTPVRKSYIRGRWIDDEMGEMAQWKNFFKYVEKSDFLMGRTQPSPGYRPMRANLEWITKPANYLKIYEEQYHGR